ncbi:MAG TPA: hypothetical protein VLZ78_00765 [Terrimesophilobacter sp.]|nr:hypothetical protein [Terrimesophilobacter sp.]
MADLTHLEAKLQRAARHLQELETTGFQFLDGVSQLMLESPNPKVRDVVADPTRNSYLVTLTLPSPPVEISLALGDFLHNLRASLDYLARELVLAAAANHWMALQGLLSQSFSRLPRASSIFGPARGTEFVAFWLRCSPTRILTSGGSATRSRCSSNSTIATSIDC